MPYQQEFKECKFHLLQDYCRRSKLKRNLLEIDGGAYLSLRRRFRIPVHDTSAVREQMYEIRHSLRLTRSLQKGDKIGRCIIFVSRVLKNEIKEENR